jgi:hypothetical protein
MSLRTLLASAVMIVCASTGARADAKKDRDAVAKLEALYAPVVKATGAARVDAACAASAQLQAAATFSDEKAPAGAIVGDDQWGKTARAVESGLTSLVEDCKSPGHKRALINGSETAEQTLGTLDPDLHTLFELIKARTLPAGVKTFQATLAKTKLPSGSFCKQAAALAKQVGALATAPTGVDAGKWSAAAAAVKTDVDGLKCAKGTADEQVAPVLDSLQDHFTALVLLVPAS